MSDQPPDDHENTIVSVWFVIIIIIQVALFSSVVAAFWALT